MVGCSEFVLLMPPKELKVDIRQAEPSHLSLYLVFQSYKWQHKNCDLPVTLIKYCNIYIKATYFSLNLPCPKIFAAICGKDFPPPVGMFRTTWWPPKISLMAST